MSKFKIFLYSAPFQVVFDYVTRLGHEIESIYHYNTYQHHVIKGTRVIILQEQFVIHPKSGDKVTTMFPQIQVLYELDSITHRRVYKSEDLKLYESLRKRFGKAKSSNKQKP